MRAAWQVVHARRDDTQGAWYQLGGTGAGQAMTRHVSHVAVEALGQPILQTGLCAVQVDGGHANLGESKLLTPRLQRPDQLGRWNGHFFPLNEMPIVKTLHWSNEAACQAFAADLVQRPQWGRALVCLHGELGAGKTTLVRHVLQAMGVTGRIKSPTYAVVEPYEVQGQSVWHFDFYRFSDPREWEDAGFRDLFATPGLKLCEWPQKAVGFLPLADLDIHIQVDLDQSRSVKLQPHTALGEGLLA